jgi:3-isopropylmalate/(R)-2-methylmalate dehydratase small subunit
MIPIIKGSCFVVGDRITAYQIISQARWNECGEIEPELGKWAFEPYVPEFKGRPDGFRDKGWSIVVAGANFGCGGKSNDHPVLALKGAGVRLIVAASVNRIFYRNCINLGLPALECSNISADILVNDSLSCDLLKGRIENLATGAVFDGTPLSKLALEILSSNSLLNYCRGLLDTPDKIFQIT